MIGLTRRHPGILPSLVNLHSQLALACSDQVSKVSFDTDGHDLLNAKVSGKRKRVPLVCLVWRAGSKLLCRVLPSSSRIRCCAQCVQTRARYRERIVSLADLVQYEVKAAVAGDLLEINTRLTEEPQLVGLKVSSAEVTRC